MNIFAGTELPQWMQSVRKENAILGESLGTVLAGGLLGMQQDPNTIDPNTGTTKTDPKTGEPMGWLSTRKGFQQGIAEARMNQSDPNWRVKEKALEGQAVANWARAATMWQQYDATTKDMAAWTTHDLPAISKYQQELKDDPNAVPPVVESSKGMQALTQIERAQMAAQAMKIKQDSTKLAIENDKRQFEFRNAYTADPELQANIEGLGRAAWNYDAQGKTTSPSTTALQIYNSWAKEHGKDPFGYKPTAVDAAKARGEAQLKVEAAKGEVRSNIEDKRQENRIALEKIKQEGRVDIEKLKLLSRKDAKGNPLGEADFINRHYNTVYASLRKNPPVDAAGNVESEQTSAQKARQILARVYKSMSPPEAPKLATEVPKKDMPFTPPSSVSTNEVKQNVPGATNDVSFDDFQKWKKNQ